MSQSLYGLAALFALISAYFLHSALTMDVTVATPMLENAAGRVANLELMHHQNTQLAIGISTAIITALLYVGACITAVIEPKAGSEINPPSES